MSDNAALTNPTVKGVGVVLRPFKRADIGLIEEVAADPYIPLIARIPPDFTVANGAAFLDAQAERAASGRGFSLAIADTTTDRAYGQISLWLADLSSGRAALSYWISQSARGHHRAAEGLALLSDWAFRHHPLHRLTLYIEPWNTASIRTALRAGYEEEGLLRRWQLVGTESKDALIFAMLRADEIQCD